MEELRAEMWRFADERDWHQFHAPRNLVLALVGEVGEVCELFQWRGEVQPRLPTWSEAERTHLGEELSDVLLYLVRLSDRCGIDLPAAAMRKMTLNRAKYPADAARGRSDKYTRYASAGASASPPSASVETKSAATSGVVATVKRAAVVADGASSQGWATWHVCVVGVAAAAIGVAAGRLASRVWR